MWSSFRVLRTGARWCGSVRPKPQSLHAFPQTEPNDEGEAGWPCSGTPQKRRRRGGWPCFGTQPQKRRRRGWLASPSIGSAMRYGSHHNSLALSECLVKSEVDLEVAGDRDRVSVFLRRTEDPLFQGFLCLFIEAHAQSADDPDVGGVTALVDHCTQHDDTLIFRLTGFVRELWLDLFDHFGGR